MEPLNENDLNEIKSNVNDKAKNVKETKVNKDTKEDKENKETKDGKNKKDKINRAEIKPPKGSRDMSPYQMSLRAKVLGMITAIFKKHGAVEIDTPVFELKETLMGKYGEDTKLIYDLADQGGELLALRYDLTVPFARYIASNHYSSIKRFHIGKVYRRDDPIMNKGRYREFYQCDFDVVGSNYGKMIPDAECLKVAVEILQEIKVGKFQIKINHRKLLDAMIELSGISNDKFRPVCSSVDKLDKEEWSFVKKELISKGVEEDQADNLWEFVKLKDSPKKLHEVLKLNETLISNKKGAEAIEEMGVLIDFLEAFKISDFISFDLSLARGLDYYTGLIYEGVLLDGPKVGSICGGGRYDDLLGMFGSKSLPAVGISIGIERIFAILEEVYKNDPSVRASQTEVLVASVGKTNLTVERMKLLNELWEVGIKAEMLYNDVPRMDKQNDFAVSNKIPFIIFVGEDEIKEKKIKVKTMATRSDVQLSRENYLEELLKLVQDEKLRII
jgi:histidyl-tRNA synthetase